MPNSLNTQVGLRIQQIRNFRLAKDVSTVAYSDLSDILSCVDKKVSKETTGD
ncbi:MAG: hypothetical protein U5K77_01510 [Candidatus Saccharibacteria bacterium]|nr:hypothetical protein [Candidatus Saccharibacteria bacterium]